MRRKDPDAVNKAFSKQAIHYDRDDHGNTILQDLRKQIYKHVDSFLSPGSRILEHRRLRRRRVKSEPGSTL